MKEDISVSVKENYVIYHVNDVDREVSVMQDFNRVSRLNIVHTYSSAHLTLNCIQRSHYA